MLIFVVVSFCQPNYHHLDFLKAVCHVSVWKEIYKSYSVFRHTGCNYAESLSAFALLLLKETHLLQRSHQRGIPFVCRPHSVPRLLVILYSFVCLSLFL